MTESIMLADREIGDAPVRTRGRPRADLPEDLPGKVDDLLYDALYVVRIIDCNPKQLQVSVKNLAKVSKQGNLSQTDLDNALGAPDWNTPVDWPTGAPPTSGKLHTRLRTKTGALVVFHLVDLAASFIVESDGSPRSSIITADESDPPILRRPMWLKDLAREHSAVSVVLTREAVEGIEEHDYAIGLTVKDLDGGKTDIFIDPKIENDGGG